MNLRQAAQQALESMDDHMYRADTHEFYEAKEALRTALAEPERKPLTDEEIERACVPLGAAMLSFTEVARAIERAHGIKEQEP